MILIIFVVFCSSLIYYCYRTEKKWVNLISVLVAPYLFIVPLNNLVFSPMGYSVITDKVMVMLSMSILCYFAGTTLVKIKTPNIKDPGINILDGYDIKKITYVLYVIGIISLLKLFAMFRQGVFSADNIEDADGIIRQGPVGHLLNLSYSLVPIVFLYWTYNIRKIRYLIPVLLICISTFASLIKYQIIGIFVLLYIVIAQYRKSLLLRSTIILFVFVCAIFALNYYTLFSTIGLEVDPDFYIKHFWKYVAGSIIYDNQIFAGGVRVGVNIGYKLLTFLCALPNLFLSLFDIQLFPHIPLNFISVSDFGEDANVVCAFGYIYPSHGGLLEIVCYGIIVMLIGFFSAMIYKKRMLRNQTRPDIFMAVFLTYFVFFSFFGTFYIYSSAWEILVYAAFVPNLFYRKTKLSD